MSLVNNNFTYFQPVMVIIKKEHLPRETVLNIKTQCQSESPKA